MSLTTQENTNLVFSIRLLFSQYDGKSDYTNQKFRFQACHNPFSILKEELILCSLCSDPNHSAINTCWWMGISNHFKQILQLHVWLDYAMDWNMGIVAAWGESTCVTKVLRSTILHFTDIVTYPWPIRKMGCYIPLWSPISCIWARGDPEEYSTYLSLHSPTQNSRRIWG